MSPFCQMRRRSLMSIGTEGAWQLTSQGSLDRTQLTLSGGLAVTGPTSLQVANAVTPLPIDKLDQCCDHGIGQGTELPCLDEQFVGPGESGEGPQFTRSRLACGSGQRRDRGDWRSGGRDSHREDCAVLRELPGPLSAAKLTLTGGGGLTETGDYVNLQERERFWLPSFT